MPESKFLSLVPDGWLKRLCHAWVELNMEMPLPFVALTGMAILGNAIGYNVWCKKAGAANTYPNMNAWLLSPAGETRRGGGTGMLMGLAKMAGLNTFNGKATREAIIDQLKDDERMLLYVEEMAELISSREYQRNVIPFLCGVLLRPPTKFDERTRGGGKVELHSPMLSCVLTGAADWFDIMPGEATSGGLLSRFILCYLPTRTKVYMNLNDTTDGGAIQSRLACELADCSRWYSGQMPATKEAAIWGQTYAERNLAELHGCDAKWMRPHLARQVDHVLRVAIILASASGQTTMTVELLEQGLELVRYFESTIAPFHESIAEGGRVDSNVESIVRKELNGEMVLHGTLVAKVRKVTRASVNDIGRILKGMNEMNMVQRVDGPGGRAVWPPLGWRVKS